MNFNTILIKCRFLNEQGEPKGGVYTYAFKIEKEIKEHKDIKLAIPTRVQTTEGKELAVVGIFADPKEVASFADKLKFVYPITGEKQ